jgi:hypothetical protein
MVRVAERLRLARDVSLVGVLDEYCIDCYRKYHNGEITSVIPEAEAAENGQGQLPAVERRPAIIGESLADAA